MENNKTKQERESSIELLRILAAMGVVYSHFLNGGGIFTNELISHTNYMVMTLIRSVTISSVDVFVIITGYFLCSTQNRSLGKPLNLLFQVSLYSAILTFGLFLTGQADFSTKELIASAVPSNWFITLYVILYILSPYLNVVYSNLTSTRKWVVFLFILITMFSIWPMALGLASHYGFQLHGLSTYGHGGNHAGYTLINFITLFSIGAFCRKNDLMSKLNNKVLLLSILCFVLLLWGFRFIPINTEPWHMAGWYDNILVILLSTFLFLFFKNMHFNSRFINSFAKASFPCYIIHGILLGLISTESVLTLPLFESLGYVLVFIIGVYLIAWCLSTVYSYSIGRVFKQLDKISFKLV